MLGDSKQLFRVLKTALAALLVFITLVLFALHQIARDNRAGTPAEAINAVPPPVPPDNTQTLFGQLQPSISRQDRPFSAPQATPVEPAQAY